MAPGAFGQVADRYVERLSERGIQAKKLDKPIDLERLRPFRAEGGSGFADRDLRPLAKQEDIDTLILLSVEQGGTLRPYYGFIRAK